MMNERGKSDRPVVPVKSSNKAGQPAAEGMEGRGLTKGNPLEQNASRTQSRHKGVPGDRSSSLGSLNAPSALERIRQAASKDKEMRFTALFHRIYAPEALRTAYLCLKREGVDGETWRHYGEALEDNLQNLFGFTHICGKKRGNGRFTVLRQTIRKRMQAKLNAVKAEWQLRMHAPIQDTGKWLRSVVSGHIRYYGVPMNSHALYLFRFQVGRLRHRALSHRSQNGRVSWSRMRRLIDHRLPPARVHHPFPLRRMGVIT